MRVRAREWAMRARPTGSFNVTVIQVILGYNCIKPYTPEFDATLSVYLGSQHGMYV